MDFDLSMLSGAFRGEAAGRRGRRRGPAVRTGLIEVGCIVGQAFQAELVDGLCAAVDTLEPRLDVRGSSAGGDRR